MAVLNPAQRQLLLAGCTRLRERLAKMRQYVRDAAGADSASPEDFLSLEREVVDLLGAIAGDNRDSPVEIKKRFTGLARTVLTVERKRLAEELETYRDNLASHELIDQLEGRLKPFLALASEEWFQAAQPRRLPRLTDYLTLQRVQQLQPQETLAPRQVDDKFRILQPSSTISGDLRYYREQCDTRDVPVALVFLDIDDFKRFNTALGEPRVDRDVLPVFMRTIEKCVFGHGHAYRYGETKSC